MTRRQSGVTFYAALTQVTEVPGSPGFYFLQSTLTTTVSESTNGTVIVCEGPISGESENITLQIKSKSL